MKNNKGFSLVELIVVIAIMAILAAVAVIGVSVYVPKAQQANDEQLFSDIEDALVYAGYAGMFNEGESGYILLSTEGIVNKDDITEGSNLDQAMKATFGDNYKNELKLAYDEWGNNGYLNSLSPEMAWGVKNSSFMTGGRTDKLLSDVEKMTGMASNLTTIINGSVSDENVVSLSGMFTKADGTCVIDETAAKYGVTKPDGMTWEEWAAQDSENNQKYSNLLVLTAADESEQFMGTMYEENEEDRYVMSDASSIILEFSSYYAYAAINPGFSTTLDSYMAQLDSVGSPSEGATWYSNLQQAAKDAGFDENYDDDMKLYDQVGFLSIMSGIGNPTKEQADAITNDLSNPNLFTNGIVNTMYYNFMDNVDAMSGMYDADDEASKHPIEVGAGQVAILFVQKDGQTIITHSLPTE